MAALSAAAWAHHAKGNGMADRTDGARSVTPLNPYQINVTYGSRSAGIITNTGADWFGPLDPTKPVAPDDVRGRTWDFPAGYNIDIRPRAYEPITFGDLRGLAESYDLLRLVLETRKDQMARLNWSIVPRDEAIAAGRSEAPAALLTQAAEIEKFFRRPDGIHRWADWLRLLLEDLFVIDAPALFVYRNRGGKLLTAAAANGAPYGLHPIDGATIKRVIDDWGRTPIYPAVAYQHVLHGVPAVDYTARDLLYRPRNVRVHRAYGMSPVEQILMTVNIALRRQLFTLNYFTEGSIPDAIAGAPDEWTPDQIAAFQKNWDAMLEGNLAARRKIKFVPGGGKFTFTKEPELKGVFDEWLARVTCYAFSVSPEPFISKMNRATAETAHDAAIEEGLAPLQDFVKGWVDDIIESPDLFAAPELEFKWQDDREVDPVKQEQVLSGYVKSAIYTINEARDRLGLEPLDDPAAETPMVQTATGFVPINANTIEGKQENLDAFGPPQETAPGGTQGGDKGSRAPADGVAGGDRAAPVRAPGNGRGSAKVAEAGKSHRPFVLAKARAVRIASLPIDRAKAKSAQASMQAGVGKALRKCAKAVAGQLKTALGKVGTADKSLHKDAASDKEKAKKIADDLDLSELADAIDVTTEALTEIAQDAAQHVLAQLGVDDDSDLVDQVNEAAAEWAADRAAEMVGMRYDDDGNLVESARAEYRIDDTTRDAIRSEIADGLADNLPIDDIIARVQDSGAFSEDRAELIARHEISRANNGGLLTGARAARDDLGLTTTKSWLTAGDDLVDEDVCQPNEDQGEIGLDDDFDSGDDAPPGHPRCRCALVVNATEPDTSEADEGGDDDTEKLLIWKRDVQNEDRDDRGRWTGGGSASSSVKLTAASGRAFSGDPVSLKTSMSKQEAGALGEKVAIAYLKENGIKDARPLNTAKNNYPVDLAGDHQAIEVKTGLVSNSKGAQQWRVTIGEPGKEEKAWLKTASKEDKAKHNASKMQAAIDRKTAVVRELSKTLGEKVRPTTVTVLLNPDKKLADIFVFKGFHTRIGWTSTKMKAAYAGSFHYK